MAGVTQLQITMLHEKENRRKRYIRKLKVKYRLVLMDDATLEQKISFRLTPLNVFLATGTISIVMIFLTIYIIAFTQLREYIPGYTDVGLSRRVYDLQQKADSLEQAMVARDLLLQNIRAVITGNDVVPVTHSEKSETPSNYSAIANARSADDSLLRVEVENADRYSLRPSQNPGGNSLALIYYTPVKGFVTNKFDATTKHFGIDIAAPHNEAVKAVRDGTVLYTGWSIETGYSIMIQHSGNEVSVYKHNSAILKKQGESVRAGDPVAIIGNSGEFTTGPHLHFELWKNGVPVDPEQFIQF